MALKVEIANLPEFKAGMRALRIQVNDDMRKLAGSVGKTALARTKALTPVDSGQTRDKWRLISLNTGSAQGKVQGHFFVMIDHPYNQVGAARTITDDFGNRKRQVVNDGTFNLLEALEYGTSAHTIRPKDGKFLRFKIGSETIFTKEVQHPGTRAYNMTTIAAAEAQRDANAGLERILRRAIRKSEGIGK